MNDTLLDILDIEKPSIDLDLFLNTYVPMLFDEDEGKFSRHWLDEISMTLFIEVNVKRPDGSIIYIIPPLAKTPESNGTSDIQMVMNEAQLEGAMHPARGESVLRKNIPHVMDVTTKTKEVVEDVWIRILKDAGYEDKVGKFSETIAANSNVVDDEDDEW